MNNLHTLQGRRNGGASVERGAVLDHRQAKARALAVLGGGDPLIASRDAFDALAARIADKTTSVEDAVREVVVTWHVPGLEFTEEALGTCFQVHPGSPIAIWFGYRKALIEGVRKN